MTTTPTQYESVDARCTCGWRSKPTTASAAIGLAAAHRRRWENLLHSFQHETTVGPVTLDADVQALAAAAKHQYAEQAGPEAHLYGRRYTRTGGSWEVVATAGPARTVVWKARGRTRIGMRWAFFEAGVRARIAYVRHHA